LSKQGKKNYLRNRRQILPVHRTLWEKEMHRLLIALVQAAWSKADYSKEYQEVFSCAKHGPWGLLQEKGTKEGPAPS
jgi:hypothetical protein